MLVLSGMMFVEQSLFDGRYRRETNTHEYFMVKLSRLAYRSEVK
jgi:hypothetical protein